MPETPTSPDRALDADAKQTDDMPRRGPAGDAQPNVQDPDPRTRGGQRQEDVEDRPNVGTVTPDDYPAADRAAGKPVPDA